MADRPTKTAEHIGNHFSEDRADVEYMRYQPTCWTRPVYSLSDGYWSAGPTPPRHTKQSDGGLEWEKVISSYDKKTVLWFAQNEE